MASGTVRIRIGGVGLSRSCAVALCDDRIEPAPSDLTPTRYKLDHCAAPYTTPLDELFKRASSFQESLARRRTLQTSLPPRQRGPPARRSQHRRRQGRGKGGVCGRGCGK